MYSEYSDEYLEGIRLFNDEQFWHAHEQWETCWHAASEPDGTFYKGIIQAAAALEHWQRGNPRGLRRNWAKSLSKLETLRSPYHGIDLEVLKQMMDCFIAAQETESTQNAPVPKIHLLDTAL